MSNIKFSDLKKTRNGAIGDIIKFMPWLQSTAPYIEEALLETNGKAERMDVTVFNFENQLLNLLKDRTLFGDFQNLDGNPDDPFGHYKAKMIICQQSILVTDTRMHIKIIISPDTEMLIPIIFACDETKVSNQGKVSSWPLIFTLSILNQTMRNKPSAWHLLGYIPDLKLNTSINEENNMMCT